VFSTWRSLASRFYRNGETKIVDLADLGVVEIALHPPGKDIWLSDVLRQGHLIEHHITLLLSEFLRPGATFLDIGANFGWFSVIGSRLAGESGCVLAVEPDRGNLRLLRRNLRLNGCSNVLVFPVALGDRNRKAMLYRSADNQGDHWLAVNSDRSDKVRVPVVCVDHMLAGQARKIDFIKIDTQGSEAAILRGMPSVFARNRQVRMVMEFWPKGLENCGASVAELADCLKRLGGRYWFLHWDNTTERVDPDEIEEIGLTRYSPLVGNHTDIVRCPSDDAELASYLAKLESDRERLRLLAGC